MKEKRVLIVGGGAAGYFAAITVAQGNSDFKVVIVEAGARTLQKVAVSGGGRCNVTHACFDEKKLVDAYPRGHRELRGPFSRFQPRDTVKWFKSRGVKLKTEADGRMFPVSDSSRTIIDCFEKSRRDAGIELRNKTKVKSIEFSGEGGFNVNLASGGNAYFEKHDVVLIATGSSKSGHEMARELGHTIIPCVPSLFTFEISDPRLEGLAGVSVPSAEVSISFSKKDKLIETGPVLITHWGISGPGIIKLSAWGARQLYDRNYQAELKINWCANLAKGELVSQIEEFRTSQAKKLVHKHMPIILPKRLWESLCLASGIRENMRYSELNRKLSERLIEEILSGSFRIGGKGVFKDEFVTCGGVSLKEIDTRRMESKLVPNLHFAGEVLDIDGITGGYNFQNAWTTGFIAGLSILER